METGRLPDSFPVMHHQCTGGGSSSSSNTQAAAAAAAAAVAAAAAASAAAGRCRGNSSPSLDGSVPDSSLAHTKGIK